MNNQEKGVPYQINYIPNFDDMFYCCVLTHKLGIEIRRMEYFIKHAGRCKNVIDSIRLTLRAVFCVIEISILQKELGEQMDLLIPKKKEVKVLLLN